MILAVPFGYAQASAGDNVTGFAWSDMPDGSDQIISPGNPTGGRGAGWISMNNLSDGTPNAYGVSINTTTGVWSGYGWSEHMGWINFAPSGPYPTQPGNTGNGVKTNITNGKTCGWARALAGGTPQSGGWDGWISMCGTGFQVTVNITAGTMSGKAWGDMVMGWIDFSQVKVVLSNTLCGTFPTAPTLPAMGICINGATASPVAKNWQNTQYYWDCIPAGGGAGQQCTMPIAVTPNPGVCGSASGTYSPSAPTTGLCGPGNTASTVSVDLGNGTSSWTCTPPGGTAAPCATVTNPNQNPNSAICSYPNGTSSATAPTVGTCAGLGIPSMVQAQGNTGWSWSCTLGSIKSSTVTCNVTKTLQVCNDPSATNNTLAGPCQYCPAGQMNSGGTCIACTDPLLCPSNPGGPIKPIYKEN